jgi:SecD/SecF fusion protein
MSSSPVRAAIIAIVAIVGLLLAVPSFLPKAVYDAWPTWLPKSTLVLGLDLQGGSHLLLQVNRDSIIAERIKDLRRDARSVLANDNGIGNIITATPEGVSVELTDATQKAAALTALQSLQNNVAATLGVGGIPELAFSELADGKLAVTLTPEGVTARMSALIAQSIEVIRNRVDEVGTTEPTIQRQGENRVLVQVPGFDDSSRLKDLISRTARLTFHLVHPTMTAAQAEQQGIPPGYMIVPSGEGGAELLNENVELGGESLTNAQPAFDQQSGRSVVSFSFDTRGAIVFGEITSANVGKRFAIVLDNEVITAPVIQTAITGGTGQISGNFTAQSANDLAVLLRAGALPATLDIVEERSVGPSLGADSIAAGITAGLVAGATVVVFMLAAYGIFGAFAVVSLVLNVVLMLGALSALGATLTLPGIAGIVLTIGMAVDANVLIYERIREELNSGKSVVAAINSGFERAWATIVDSHLTQLISAIVLYFLGSGPIQGFAVTLALGILTSLFTAYTVTLFQVGVWFRIRRPKSIKIQIMRLIPDGTKIPFMRLARPVAVFSIVMMLLSVGGAVFHGFNLGIDFKGGTAIEVRHLDGPADPAALRELLGTLDLGEVQVQSFGTPEDVLVRIEEQSTDDAAQQEAVERITTALADESYEVRRVEAVSGTVSSELVWSGTIAVLVALVAILAYVWFRFEWQFAVGAIITTAHDVILTIGLYAWTGLEFNLTSIAAVLTLVGLSLNDTVVIYDRIREYLRKYKKMPLADLIDLSINSTLARTLLTTLTTFMALVPLVLFGGEVIRGFVTAMTFGLFVGTYSSIIVGAPLLILFGLKSRADVVDEKAKTPRRADGAAV